MKKTPFLIHAASVGDDLFSLWHIAAILPSLPEAVERGGRATAKLVEAHFLLVMSERMHSVAFKMRALDDAMGEGKKSILRSGSCGRLWRGESAASRPLTPREACNKIIHWDDIEPDGNDTEIGIIEISGEDRGGVKWRAHLSLEDFAVRCIQAMDAWGLLDKAASRGIMAE